MTDTFLAHYADIHDSSHHAHINRQLRDHGLATFGGIRDRATLLTAARPLLTVRPHRDAGPDGITVITSRADASTPGYAAFATTGLSPHTDGTSLPAPPHLVMLACLVPGTDGGESYLTDGSRVFSTLAEHDPEALGALAAPRSAFFGTADGYLGSVFEDAGGGRVSVRLRTDELARFSPDITRILPRLRATIDQHKVSLRLRPGEGYLLDNSRWLHGRRRFTGERVMIRILGDPLPETAIYPGFTPWTTPHDQEDQAREFRSYAEQQAIM